MKFAVGFATLASLGTGANLEEKLTHNLSTSFHMHAHARCLPYAWAHASTTMHKLSAHALVCICIVDATYMCICAQMLVHKHVPMHGHMHAFVM